MKENPIGTLILIAIVIAAVVYFVRGRNKNSGGTDGTNGNGGDSRTHLE